MITRRMMLAGSGASLALIPTPIIADDGPVLGDDGLYHQSWFLDSFLELKDDIEEAAEAGKQLVIFWELRGCPYCKETHFTNLGRKDIREFIQANFVVLQLNILGSRLVVDVDGEELSEKKLASRYGVRFTPTFQFLGDDVAQMTDSKPRKREVARAQGYLKPDHFLLMFEYVQSRSYQTLSFRQYLKSRKSS
ncbi:MAG: thioredoxin fold domain-containing protein [Hyphomicrobiales bacterium]|nr:thioredoxin fold domain-containing protein [Hyphomicrobiales bacterium]